MKTKAWTILPFPCAISAGRRALRKNLLRALRVSESRVIVDFSGCHGLNHEDIDLLLECVAQVAGRDVEVLFAAGSRANRVLLEVTRISSLVPVFDSVQEAQDHLQMAAEGNAGDQHATQSQGPWSA